MDISVKQLVELLDFDSPVFFTEKEKLNKENYFYFQPMGDAEKEAIQNCTYDPRVYMTRLAGGCICQMSCQVSISSLRVAEILLR